MISPKAERFHLAFPVPQSTSTVAALLPATHSTTLSRFPTSLAMDTAIDLSDASKALDLANIRFQLM